MVAPGAQVVTVVENAEKSIADIITKINSFYSGKWAAYRQQAESTKLSLFKDYKAIERILVMDARGLFDVVMNERISMCGFGPTVAMLIAARRMGATSTELVRYATSGDVSGDRERVVGYAGVIVR